LTFGVASPDCAARLPDLLRALLAAVGISEKQHSVQVDYALGYMAWLMELRDQAKAGAIELQCGSPRAKSQLPTAQSPPVVGW